MPGAEGDLDILLTAERLFDLSPDDVRELRLRHIGESLEFHLAANAAYRRYCESVSYEPDGLAGYHRLDSLPLMPVSLFKRTPDRVASEVDGKILETTSSGTMGTVSRVPRDDLTLTRFFATISVAIRELMGIERFDLPLFNLGPADIQYTWASYVLSGIAVFFPSTAYTWDGACHTALALEDLRGLPRGRPAVVIGPPFLLLELAAEAARMGAPALPDSSWVMTVGGWKRFAGAIPPDEFAHKVGTALGVAPERIRDTYNMVEVNSVIVECERRIKHVPPWLYVRARHPRTLAVLPSGAKGVLSFLDPTPRSYPGYLLSEDIGIVHEDFACGCGRTTDAVEIVRRVNRVESRGCALRIEAMTE